MTEVTNQLPSASAVFGLQNRKIDKEVASKGLWCEVDRDAKGYVIEMLVLSTDVAKDFQTELTSWMSDRFQKQGKGYKDMQEFIMKDKATREAMQKVSAKLASKYLVKGWRTFCPTLDENGNMSFDEETGDVVGFYAEMDGATVISNGEEWLKFNTGACERVLKDMPHWTTEVTSFAQDDENFYVKKVADKSSIAA